MGYVFNPFTGTFDNAPSTVNGESVYSTVVSNSADWGANPQIMEATVYNADSTTLIRGNVVYSFGATGDTMSVKLASNSAESTSSKTLGFVNDTIAPGEIGTVTIAGRMEHLPLGSPFVDGDALWLGSTPGSYTRVKPTAPNHGVYLGVAERANNGNGIAYVKVQNGYELNEIHDVSISDIAAGQVLRRNNANTLWQNVSDAANWDSVYTTVQSNSGTWQTVQGIGLFTPLSGGRMTGKLSLPAATSSSAPLNLGSSGIQPTAPLSGDVWIRNNLIQYRGSSSTVNSVAATAEPNVFTVRQAIQATDNSNAALRVTQLGTGDAIRVEDETNPDATPFIVDALGNLAIGLSSVPVGGPKATINGSISATNAVYANTVSLSSLTFTGILTSSATSTATDTYIKVTVDNVDKFIRLFDLP